MRLIDADAITRSTELTKKIVSYDLTPYIKVDDLIQFIDNLPTAYDISKVVAELDEEAVSDEYGKLIGLEDAIDIVRKGGIDEIPMDESYK